MSTPVPSNPPPVNPVPVMVAPTASAHREIKLISHSNLFYWWPVWVSAFFMFGWTMIENTRMATVPHDAKLKSAGVDADGKSHTFTLKTAQNDITRVSAKGVEHSDNARPGDAFPVHISQHAWLGSVFMMILLLVMVITNVPLRGLWSFLVIILIVVIALFIHVFHGWDEVFERIANLRIYINASGYLTIGVATVIVWALATFIFDSRTYVIFTPGQIKLCEHIGASVRTFDTAGVTFEKQRDDLFRHYILGFGSGDLIIRTIGADRHEIRLPNVLGIGWQLQAVENMLRERTMTTS